MTQVRKPIAMKNKKGSFFLTQSLKQYVIHALPIKINTFHYPYNLIILVCMCPEHCRSHKPVCWSFADTKFSVQASIPH